MLVEKVYCPNPACHSGNTYLSKGENVCRRCGKRFKTEDGFVLAPYKVLDVC